MQDSIKNLKIEHRARDFTDKKLVFVAAFSLFFSINVSAQKPIDKPTLARFEKSIAAGKIEEIERPLLDAAVANPNDWQVLELLAAVRLRQNRLPEAAALYKRVLTLGAENVSAKINLARIFHRSGQPDEAKKMLDAVAENAVTDAPLRLNLAATFLQIGEPQKALGAAEKLPAKIKNSDALPVVAASYAALGNKQKLRELLPAMKRAATANPDLAVRCAEILLHAEMRGEAAGLLRAGLKNAPNDFGATIALAKLETETKNFASAKQLLAQAVRRKPRVVETFHAQALFAEAQGDSAAALEFLKQARALAPHAPEILRQFVVSAMRANQSRQAVAAARALVEVRPDEPESLYLLGAASLQNNNLAEAQTNLRRLLELRPNDARGCLALGLTFAAQPDQIEAARAQLARCVEIDPGNFEAKYQLGLSYKTQGENRRAAEFFEETIKIVPSYAPALRDLGAVYLQIGTEKEARGVLEKAVALAPEDADTHFQLSRLYNLTGETQLARKHLETFQKLRSAAVK